MAACQQSGPTAESQLTPSSPPIPGAFGILIGQISPCYGGDTRIGFATPPPEHPAGVAVVLRGTVTWQPDGTGGFSLHLPTQSVASESVPAGGQFRFVLAPGPYVVITEPSGVYTSVSVVAGQTINTKDVPQPPCR